MNNILPYIESQILCIFLLGTLFCYNNKHERTPKKIIKTIYGITFFSAITDIARCLLNGTSLIPLLHITNILYLSSFGFIGLLWFMYCVRRYNIKASEHTLFKVLSSVPAFLVLVFSLFSSVNGWLYYIDVNGFYHRGPLFLILAVDYLYIAGVWFFALKSKKKVSLDRKRYEYISMAVLTLPSLLAGIVQLILPNGLSVMTYSIFIALFMFFISLQYKKIRIDNLTKLHNRYGMNDEIKKQLDQYEKDKNDLFYIIACDLDDFKHINDTWGHLEGDRALILVSDVLARISEEYNSVAFRIGGDEFVIIVDTSDHELIKELCTKLENALSAIKFRDDYDIKMSMGFAIYNGGDDIEELLNFADMQLYEVKRKKKNK